MFETPQAGTYPQIYHEYAGSYVHIRTITNSIIIPNVLSPQRLRATEDDVRTGAGVVEARY